MTKSAAEAEMEVENSRVELDRTVEALKDKMTPGQLFDEAARTMGGAGNQILSKFLEQAKENPMPLAVMGLGLAWLMSSNKRPQPAYERSSYSAYTGETAGGPYDGAAHDGPGLIDKAKDAMSGASDALHRASDKASDVASHAQERLVNGASYARERISSTASDAMRSARDVSDKVAQTTSAVAHRTQQRVTDLIEREPLIVGGLGLVAGLALGAALPATQAEKRYIGPTHDRLLDKTKEMAKEGLDTLREVTQAAYSGIKDELQHGEQGQTPAERAENVVTAGIQAAREQSGQPH